MKWQFTTPDAPHQNGCSEAVVNTVKKSLKKAIGDTVLTPFELYTCLANLVNQRLIGRIPNDPDDGAYLCPNDILLGRATSTVPQGPFVTQRIPAINLNSARKLWIHFGRNGQEMSCHTLYPGKSGMLKEEMLQSTISLFWPTRTQFVESGVLAGFFECFQEKTVWYGTCKSRPPQEHTCVPLPRFA